MKVFVTKYALTKGILLVEGSRSDNAPSMFVGSGAYRPCFHGEGRDWHHTEEGARDRVEVMLAAKIKSVKAQLKKLEAMDGNSMPIVKWGAK